MSAHTESVIDYRNANAANLLLPRPSLLSSAGWSHLHLEVFQQPEFEIAEHYHTMHVIACGLSDLPEALGQETRLASGERWLDGEWQQERRQAGDIAIVPAGVPHRCNWSRSTQFMVLAIEPELLHQVGQDIVNCDRIELVPQFMNQSDRLIQGIFAALKEELEIGKIGGHLLIDSLKTTLAIHLLRNYCTTQPKTPTDVNGLSQLVLKQITDYIHESLNQDLKLDDLAAIAQLSPYHFLRLFRQQMGITPHQYILRCRIDAAKHLLKYDHLSIAEIAVRVGFSDQSHLTRCFKRAVGMTPKQLRQSL